MKRSATACMLKPWVVSALAKAFLAGEPLPDAMEERCAKLFGKRWDWLPPLALRFTEALAEGLPPRGLNVIRFISEDQELQKAVGEQDIQLSPEAWLPQIPQMQQVAAAQSWALPRIETPGELATWFDLSFAELAWLADLKALGYKRTNTKLRHYWYRVLQKDSSSIRLIEAPKQRLKELERRMLTEILEKIPLHESVHGFRKGRSIQTFCAPHVAQRTVIKMDLQDFFPSISGARIQSLFRTIGYPEAVAALLAGLSTNAAPPDIWKQAPWTTKMLYGRPHLPQGAPTSPALANLCAYHMDCRLHGLAKAAGANYTRYADDIAFSGAEDFARSAERFSIRAAAIIAEEGFAVHHRKTRIMRQSVRQHLAGLVVNQRLNIRRTDFDELKAILTNCARSGPASQNRHNHKDFRAHLQGRVAFLNSINPAKGAKLESLLRQIDWGN